MCVCVCVCACAASRTSGPALQAGSTTFVTSGSAELPTCLYFITHVHFFPVRSALEIDKTDFYGFRERCDVWDLCGAYVALQFPHI